MMKALLDYSIGQQCYKRCEYIKHPNTTDVNLYYIHSGSVKIAAIDDSGNEQIMRLGYREDFITCLDSFISNKPSHLHIQAIKKTVVSVIPKIQVEKFLALPLHKEIWAFFLTNTILDLLEREQDLLIANARLRYEKLLQRSPRIFQEIPKRHIANYLRMSEETLSRLKKH